MQQLEIQYFFPLTEQIPLDLDFTPCVEFQKRKYENSVIGTSGMVLSVANGGTTWTTANVASTIQFRRDDKSVGYWKVGEGFHMHNKKKPNWLHQKMTKIFFGWEWKDK